jgi:hypothetical protein
MEDTSSPQRVEASLPPARKAWAEPAILLERSLQVEAEGTPPGDRRGARIRRNGFLGPLGTSGGTGSCD